MNSLFDRDYRRRYRIIAGLDEAGRGPLAGPLVASAVVLPEAFSHPVLDDSKKLTDKRRRELLPLIQDNAVAFSAGVVTPGEIDDNRMAWAVRASFKRAMKPLGETADVFLVDGNSVSGLEYPCVFIVRGDSKSLSIAAASIVAKVTRDDMMIQAEKDYPGYGFAKHKGYGTKAHFEALKKLGPSPLHRMSFEPLRSIYATGQLSLFPMQGKKPGKAGEAKAAGYLEKLGYEILHMNWMCSGGEIDIVAEKENTVFFVEVKSFFSGREDLALGRINRAKIRRIRNAASLWMAEMNYRGDVSFLCALYSPESIRLIPMN